MRKIQNPVLKGFAPDPSICRVEDDYYIATSTFEWYPGVQIFHSTDLENWRIAARPLTRYSQLDLRGRPNSGGIWAPALSYAEGLFYLIYTDVKTWVGSFKDVHNYLVTAPKIEGPWSEPIYLNSSGFDPSLFHDDDGRKWLLNMVWDHRPKQNEFGGIFLQEYDSRQQKLVGPAKNIFSGSNLGSTEGPHLYKKDGWYYLITAEGSTFTTHAETVARSQQLDGPYEIMPGNPLITSSHDQSLLLHSAGHGSLVEHRDGSWALVHLCRRPLANGRSILGRETAIQNIVWQNGWPRLVSGGRTPLDTFDAPDLPASPVPELPAREVFDTETLPNHWQAPRVPIDEEMASLNARKGYLRLYGRESIVSLFEQSLIARRQQGFHIEASTCVEFTPESFQQMAGLVAFYSTESFYYLYLTQAADSKRSLGLMRCARSELSFPFEKEYPLDGCGQVFLKLVIKNDRILFYYSADGEDWNAAGTEYDASILSDEYAVHCGFTGNFVGMACQDLTGRRHHADFKYFECRELIESC